MQKLFGVTTDAERDAVKNLGQKIISKDKKEQNKDHKQQLTESDKLLKSLQQQIYAIQYLHQKQMIDGTNNNTNDKESSQSIIEPARVILLPVDSSDHCKQCIQFASVNILSKGDIVILMQIWQKDEIGTFDSMTVGYIPPDFAAQQENLTKQVNKIHYVKATQILKSMIKEYIAPNRSSKSSRKIDNGDDDDDKEKEQEKEKESMDSGTDLHILSLLMPAISQDNPSTTQIGQIVLDTALKLKCSMIIMGARGVGHLKSMIMGSVSQYVVKHGKGKVPVIVVHQ